MVKEFNCLKHKKRMDKMLRFLIFINLMHGLFVQKMLVWLYHLSKIFNYMMEKDTHMQKQ
jgi:hypothetical protein